MKKRNKAVFIPNGEKEEEGEYITLGKEYEIPLLEALIDLGGEGKVWEIYERVEKKMKLKEVDHEILPSGKAVRWKNNVQWARQRLKERGLLDKTAPPRVWRITEEGREYYQVKIRNLPKH